MSKFKNWVITKAYGTQDEEGQGLAEYGLILALIAIVCAIALTTLQGAITGVLNEVAGALTGS